MKAQNLSLILSILIILVSHSYSFSYQNVTTNINCYTRIQSYTSQFSVCHGQWMDEEQVGVIDYSNPNNQTSFSIDMSLCYFSMPNQIGVNSEGNLFCLMNTVNSFALRVFDIANGEASSRVNVSISTGILFFTFTSLDHIIIYAPPPSMEAIIIDTLLNDVVCNISMPSQQNYSDLSSIVGFDYNSQTNITNFVYVYSLLYDNVQEDLGFLAITYNCTDNTENHINFPVNNSNFYNLREFFFMNYNGTSVFLLNNNGGYISFHCQIFTNGSYYDTEFVMSKMIKLNDTDIIAIGQQKLRYYRLDSPTSLKVIHEIYFGAEIKDMVWSHGQPIYLQTEYANFLVHSSNFSIIKILPAMPYYVLFSNGSYACYSYDQIDLIFLYAFNGKNLYVSSYQVLITFRFYSTYPYTDYWNIIASNGTNTSQLLHINIQTNEVQLLSIPFYIGTSDDFQILAAQISSSTLFLSISINGVISTLNNGTITNQTLKSSNPVLFHNGQTSNLVNADQKLTEETYCIVDYSNWIFYTYDGFTDKLIQTINLIQVSNLITIISGYSENQISFYPVVTDPTNNEIIVMLFEQNALNGYLNKDGYVVYLSNNLIPSYNYFNSTVFPEGSSYFYQLTLTDWSSPEGFNLNPEVNSINWIVLLTIFVGAVVVFIMGVGVDMMIERKKRLKAKDLEINLEITEIKN